MIQHDSENSLIVKFLRVFERRGAERVSLSSRPRTPEEYRRYKPEPDSSG